MQAHDWQLNLRATDHPEFDAWRWNDYWVQLDAVVDFKRGVYQMALTELSRYLPRQDGRQRLYRATPRMGHADTHGLHPHGMELPPGGSFDPHPDGSDH